MTLRMRVLPRFPSKISSGAGIKIDRPIGSTDLVVSIDVSNLVRVPSVLDGDKVFFLAWNSDLNSYSIMSFTDTFLAVVDTTGLMLQSVYDPQGKEDDAFDRANHTGTQNVSTIDGITAFARSVLDDTTGAAMFATMGASFSGTASSWVAKFPNGLKMQGGTSLHAVGPSGTDGIGFVWPEAFTTVCYNAFAGPSNQSSNIVCGLETITTTQATGFAKNLVTSTNTTFRWWAIGV